MISALQLIVEDWIIGSKHEVQFQLLLSIVSSHCQEPIFHLPAIEPDGFQFSIYNIFYKNILPVPNSAYLLLSHTLC